MKIDKRMLKMIKSGTKYDWNALIIFYNKDIDEEFVWEYKDNIDLDQINMIRYISGNFKKKFRIYKCNFYYYKEVFKSFIFYKIRDNYGFGGSNNSSIIRPALEHIFNLYKLEVENLYNYNKENIDTGLGIDPERKNLYKWFENNIIINDEDIRKSFKYILPVYKYITTSPKVIKRNTNDNATKYWNILEIELPLCTIDHGEAMNIIKEHKNELFQYIFWYLSVTDKEIYEMRKFLKIDNIFLTKDFILSIQYVLKGDDKAGI